MKIRSLRSAVPMLLALATLAGLAAAGRTSRAAQDALPPNVLVLTIDTLRSDRLSSYGYERPTSPHLDRLLDRGVRFTEARTVEPLTNPALSSMLTALYPHEHGGTRNGLKMRLALDSLPKQLEDRGYQTAAFVGNWTLRDRLSGLGEHFEVYEEVLTKRRWFGLFKGEADAADVTDRTLEWLETYGGRRRPYFLWAHDVDPHAPSVMHDAHAARLGLGRGKATKSDRYDTEVAYVDQHAGRLLQALEDDPRLARRTLVVFASDHGESLGEHGYWGHGRNLYEPNLHIPMGFTWPGRIAPGTLDAPALLIDVAPTVLGLLDLEVPEHFRGHDWSGVLTRAAAAPKDRATWFQAHKGAVLTDESAPRVNGLMEVGLLVGGVKEILDVDDREASRFDLRRDPEELDDLHPDDGEPSDELMAWYEQVETGLEEAGTYPPPALDEESVEKLKALGYTNR